MLILKSLRLRINPTSGVPLYWQIKEEIGRLVSLGLIKEGEKLPSVRELAVELRVNPNTVARVYQLLKKEKVLVTKRGKGTFVGKVNRFQKEEKLTLLIEKFLKEAEMAGFSRGEVLRAVKNILKDYERGEG